MKILLVESKEDMLALLRHTLSQHTEIHARNRAEASWMFIENKPDIVLVNKILDDSSDNAGMGAAQDILNLNSSAKVIMYAARGTVSKQDEKVGIELFIPEPLIKRKILTSVEAVLTLKHSMLLVPC